MNLGEKFALPVLLYLFRRIEQSLDGRPTLIILDEAWLMLAHPVFRIKSPNGSTAMAKKNCCVLMATQHLSHAVNSGILEVIVESTASKIFLPNPNARAKNLLQPMPRWDLTQLKLTLLPVLFLNEITTTSVKKAVVLYSLALGPLALSFVGATDKESIAMIQQLEKTHKANWVHEWLRTKGLALNDYGVTA
ncbi:VirB4 family type IV secretion/conjugal transfer ATPase (plasmid) [Legionella sp. PC1000]|uniref:hypothetical protein n=1 Tax=Legionella sp. PC1000 TaxID=2746060 RepID=UPI0018608A37|nr:hypothetical protein [Legionella sp. PC1000]QLZ70870.1 VirB4 family type IV secretion/conjugal transfer ATPase [Legionella sp. PC1000]